jgi:hypothetical protein
MSIKPPPRPSETAPADIFTCGSKLVWYILHHKDQHLSPVEQSPKKGALSERSLLINLTPSVQVKPSVNHSCRPAHLTPPGQIHVSFQEQRTADRRFDAGILARLFVWPTQQSGSAARWSPQPSILPRHAHRVAPPLCLAVRARNVRSTIPSHLRRVVVEGDLF